MRLAISNIAWEKSRDEDAYALLRETGFCGLEIAPTRVFAKNPYEHLQEAEKWSSELKRKYGLEVASVQSVWYGRNERLFGEREEREILTAYTQSAIDFAAAVGSHNLVFGCPRNRTIPDGMPPDEAEEIAVDFFKRLGEYARGRNTVLAIEANPPIYHTNYINTTAEAFALVKKIDSRGIRLNADLGTILQNGEDIGFLADKTEYINHVHISEPGLGLIADRKEHRVLAALLRKYGYQNYVSVEMSLRDDLTEVADVMRYIKKVSGTGEI